MNPAKVKRKAVTKLTDLPNVGPSIAKDLRSIGIEKPGQIEGKDAFALYAALCEKTGVRQDPCLLDVMMSAVDFMNGNEARVWWDYTAQRKRLYGQGCA